MTMRFARTGFATAVAALAVSVLAPVGMHAASAASVSPPWEPDPNSAAPYGGLVFYDASGNVVTSGGNLNHLFDYAAATTNSPTSGVKAIADFAAPKSGAVTGTWAQTQVDALSTAFPNSTFPPPIQGPGFTHPVVKFAATDADLVGVLGGFQLDSTAGYANVIQVRVYDNGPNGSSAPNYWSADIAYNNTASPITLSFYNNLTVPANSWTQLYPPTITSTTTNLTSSAAKPSYGKSVPSPRRSALCLTAARSHSRTTGPRSADAARRPSTPPRVKPPAPSSTRR